MVIELLGFAEIFIFFTPAAVVSVLVDSHIMNMTFISSSEEKIEHIICGFSTHEIYVFHFL